MMHSEKYDLVLFSLTFYPDVDATAKLMTDLATYIAEKGKKVLVVTPNRSYEVPERKYQDFETVSQVDVVRVKIPKLDKNSLIQKVVFYYLFATGARKLAKELDYKVAMAILPPFFVAYNVLRITKKTGKKFVFVLHDLHPDVLVRWKQLSPKNPLVLLLKKQNVYIFQNADKVVFIGRDQIAYTKQEYHVEDSKACFIPNWSRDLKEGFLEKQDVREKYYKSGFNILYAGNMGEAQLTKLERMIFLMSDERLRKNDVNLIMVGHGRIKDHLVRFAQEKDAKNVFFYDYVYDFSEYQNLVYFCDCCFVGLRNESKGMSVPSKTYYYLSGGKPILADVPVDSEIDILIKENECGFNISNMSDEKVVERILLMKEDRKFYSKLCENARTAFEIYYTKDIALQKYLDLLEALWGQRKETFINV